MKLGYRRWIATGLAHAMLADSHVPAARSIEALHARGVQCIAADPPWLKLLAGAIAREFQLRWQWHTVPRLADWIAARPELDAAFDGEHALPRVRRLLLRPARMVASAFALSGLAIPRWDTPSDLAAWLGLSGGELDWLCAAYANFREPAATPHFQPSSHYVCQLKVKNAGGLRLIEAPKATLRGVQRRLLHGLLDAIPAHESAHGFVRARSVLTHAAGHSGRETVLSFDLKDFFHSVGIGRVRALFRTLGYAEGVAAALARLTTTRTPRGVRERLLEEGSIDRLGAARLAAPHLPQGAPCSPALANLCAFQLDLRLDGLAWRFGAHYSRYADDLVFSGPAGLMRDRRVLQAWIEAIARAEGFALHPGKVRAMPAHARQRVTGIVVNERPNLERQAYDLLKARLHAATSGCDAQTRLRLAGEVGWAAQLVVPSRARKLRALLDAVPTYDGAPAGTGN
jgi:RNA-directed DNA polymerase